jgi:serine phosphatase RsbU (regulator of sigma subunit)/ABC-type amino acid transport substrate-binding protein
MALWASPARSEPTAASAFEYKGSVELNDAELRWLAEHPVIRLAPYGNYPPREFVDESGRHQGIGADYARLIENRLGAKFEKVFFGEWPEILGALRSRQADMLALAAESPEQREFLLFAKPYLEFPAVIIVRDDTQGELEPEDLAGLKVAVGRGYSVAEYLRTRWPDIELAETRDTRAALRQVSLGLVSAAVVDLAAASYFIERDGIANLRVAGETNYIYRMGFACRSDWPELRAILEKALDSITPQEREEIYRRWISLGQEERFARRLIWRALGPALGAVFVLVAGILIWNRALKRQVGARTKQLEELNATLESRVAERSTELERHIELLSVANKRMRRDLEAAAKVQSRFLPRESPAIAGYEVGWVFSPCEYIGGDLLNVFRVDNSRWAFYVLDVAGHGVPAALLSVSLSRVMAPSPAEEAEWDGFRRVAPEELADPERMTRLVNNHLLKDADRTTFCTMLYAVLDLRDHTVEWVRAGHEPPLIIRRDGKEAEFHEEPGALALGLVPSEELQVRSGCVSLEPGDRFIIFSDGATETFREGQMFGKARLADYLSGASNEPLQQSIQSVLRASADWSGREVFGDDVTILALERRIGEQSREVLGPKLSEE